MLTAAKWALGIVPAGIVLGALLGSAVNPDMKDAPEPWWRLTGSDAFTASAEPDPEIWPQDFAAAGGYRPDLDYDAEVWALPISAYELAILIDEPATELPPIEQEIIVAEDAAAEAEAAAEDALAAQTPAPAPEPETAPGEVRKSELAQAGLY
jgi:hypothetical protein